LIRILEDVDGFTIGDEVGVPAEEGRRLCASRDSPAVSGEMAGAPKARLVRVLEGTAVSARSVERETRPE
jgi:hypothetical protein